MAVQLSGRTIFLASPSDVADERALLHTLVRRFNREHALPAGVSFIVKGWEDVPGGVGRPQETINALLDESDYLVLVLGERWGTPPGGDGGYSSGTEEEFEHACKLLAAPDAPMRDMHILFRTVDRTRLDDPGPQLQKVLEFKARIEDGKQILFSTFDSDQTFEQRIVQALIKWLKPLEDKMPTSIDLESNVAVPAAPESYSTAEILSEARDLADRGQIVQAERLYAYAAREDDPTALSEFSKFMRRTGRLESALELTEAILSSPVVIMSGASESVVRRVEAIANLGVIKRKLGDLSGSLASLEEAVQTAHTSSLASTDVFAYALDNLGHTLDSLGRPDEARGRFEEAANLRKESADETSRASSDINLGWNSLRSGDTERASEFFQSAIDLLGEDGDPRLRANALTGAAETLSRKDRQVSAIPLLERALELNRQTRNSDGMSIVNGKLASASLAIGNVSGARRFANDCLEESQRSGNARGLKVAAELHRDIATRDSVDARRAPLAAE